MSIARFRSTPPESLVDTTMCEGTISDLQTMVFVQDEDDGSPCKGIWQGKKVTIPCVISLFVSSGCPNYKGLETYALLWFISDV